MENGPARGPSGIWRRGSESNRRRRLCRPLHNHFATPPRGAALYSRRTFAALRRAELTTPLSRTKKGSFVGFPSEFGAGEESRTLDLNLGKVALYQLSYSRVANKTSAFYDRPEIIAWLKVLSTDSNSRLTRVVPLLDHGPGFAQVVKH